MGIIWWNYVNSPIFIWNWSSYGCIFPPRQNSKILPGRGFEPNHPWFSTLNQFQWRDYDFHGCFVCAIGHKCNELISKYNNNELKKKMKIEDFFFENSVKFSSRFRMTDLNGVKTIFFSQLKMTRFEKIVFFCSKCSYFLEHFGPLLGPLRPPGGPLKDPWINLMPKY